MKLFKIIMALSIVALIFSCSEEEVTKTIGIPLCIENHNIETRQERITVVPLFTPCDAANLYMLVDFSECEQDDLALYECAFEGAVSAYNAIPSGINVGITMISDISELPPGESVNITLDCADLSGIGTSFRRYTPLDVSELLINDNVTEEYPCQPGPDCCQLQKTVMHEIGHALGFAHTQGGTSNAQWIPGTPMGEANSIFNSTWVDDCEGGCEFTEGDLAALEALYTTPSIDGPDVLCLGETAQYCLVGQGARDPDLSTVWSPQSTGQTFGQQCTTFTASAAGFHTITVWASVDGCTYSETKRVLVINVEECEKKCFCACEMEFYIGDVQETSSFMREIDCLDERSCDEIFGEDSRVECTRINQ